MEIQNVEIPKEGPWVRLIPFSGVFLYAATISFFRNLQKQLIRTTNLFQVDLFSAYVAPASRSIVPYLPERRVQGRVNISDTFEQ